MNKTFQEMTWKEYGKLFLKCSATVIIFGLILGNIA